MGAFFGCGCSGGSGSGGLVLGAFLAYTSPAGVQNDVTPVGFKASIGRLDVTLSADTSWTGFIAATIDGQMMLVTNISAFNLTLLANNVGSAAANRIRAAQGGLILTQYQSAFFVYYQGSVNQWQLR